MEEKHQSNHHYAKDLTVADKYGKAWTECPSAFFLTCWEQNRLLFTAEIVRARFAVNAVDYQNLTIGTGLKMKDVGAHLQLVRFSAGWPPQTWLFTMPRLGSM